MPRGKGRLRLLDVAAQGVINSHRLADVIGGRTDMLDSARKHQILDLVFDFFVELVAIRAEEFDAVIIVGIVRRGDNNAGVGA